MNYILMLFFYIVSVLSPWTYTRPPSEIKVAVINLRAGVPSGEMGEALSRSLREELSEAGPYLPLKSSQVREALRMEGLQEALPLKREEALRVGKRLKAGLVLTLLTREERGSLVLRFRVWDTANGELLLAGELEGKGIDAAGELGKNLAHLLAKTLREDGASSPRSSSKAPQTRTLFSTLSELLWSRASHILVI